MKAGKTQNSETWPVVCVCVFLVALVWAVFGQTASFGFVNYDDNKYIYENPVVQHGLTWQGVRWAFHYSEIGHWHPLTWLTHMADCQFFGLWAGGHHLTNVALHAATTVLLFLVLRAMTGFLWRSAFVAAVFAIHPLRAESVAWISERKDVLSGLFFMLTLWAYARYAREFKVQGSRFKVLNLKFKVFYGLLLVFLVLGLLSKNMLVTMPFVLLILDWWPLQRLKSTETFWSLVKEKIPLLLLSVASCVATASVSEKIETRIPFWERLGNAVVSVIIYMRQMVFPAGLANPYPFPHGGPAGWKVGVALVVLAAITGGAVAGRKKWPFVLVGWLWFLGMLVPVIGVVQISYYAHADRYTYLPEIGLTVAAVWALAEWSAGWRHRQAALGGLMTAVLGALVVCAHIQTSYWRDGLTWWTHTLACTSENVVAHMNLGEYLRQHGDLDGSVAQYRAALEIEPDNIISINALGTILGMKGDANAAIAQFEKGLKVRPGFADTHVNLGNVFLGQGKVREAIAQFRQALEISPGNPDIYNNLGKALAAAGEDEAAMDQYKEALQIKPDYANVHFNLANRLLKLGRLDEAAAHYRRAWEINPADADAHDRLERVLLMEQQAKLQGTNGSPPSTQK